MTANTLPAGFFSRPVCPQDLVPLMSTLNRASIDVIGVEKHQAVDYETEWKTPGFDLERDTRLVIAPDGEIAGYYEVWDLADPHVHIQVWGQTHPEYKNLGIGSYLLEWAETRARQALLKAPPEARVTMNSFVPTINTAGLRLFSDLGFKQIRYSLRMRIDFDQPPDEPVWPQGIVVRTMQVGRDESAVVMAVRESFRDHWGFVERPFDYDLALWTHRWQTSPYFDPQLHFIAWDGDQVAGTSLCYDGFYDDPQLGWISTLGVLRPWRRRGLGLALLQHSFCRLYAIGRWRIGLGVDASSLTGATRLYEKAGMHSDEQRRYAEFEKELRPGIELGTQTVA